MIAPTSFFADYGCHVRILEEARILQKLGSRVSICTYHTGRDLPELNILRTMSIPWRREYEVGSSRHKVAFDILLSLRSLRALGQARPQVIHAHLHEGALIGYVLSRLWRVPLVFDFQGSMTSEMVDHNFLKRDSRFYGFLRSLERGIDHLAPRILTSSAHASDLLVEEFGCSRNKITFLPDCVSTDVFRLFPRDEEWVRFKQAWGIPTDRLVVIYLGKLAEYQGVGHLLKAARLLCDRRDDVHFVVAGYPYVEHYRQMAADLGLADRVAFPGKVRYEDAPHILSLGDVAVSPKLSLTEGAGKLLNYMSMALPVVAYDTEVSHEYLGAEGIYAERGSVEDLVRCLGRLLDDPARRAELGARLRQRAQERYSWDAAGRTILEIYGAMSR
jgi:glycosyltransferase involved in cell wall biosynthesis